MMNSDTDGGKSTRTVVENCHDVWRNIPTFAALPLLYESCRYLFDDAGAVSGARLAVARRLRLQPDEKGLAASSQTYTLCQTFKMR